MIHDLMRACSGCGNSLDERGESGDTGVCIFCVSNAQHRKWYPHLYPDVPDVVAVEGEPTDVSSDEDERIHYEQLKQRYLVWYEGRLGGCFSIDVDGYLKRARENRDMFVGDGYSARIIKLTVVDGEPVAEWVEGNQP